MVKFFECSNSFQKFPYEVFSASGRVVMVAVHWEEWAILDSGGVARTAKYRTEKNQHSRFYDGTFEKLFRPFSPLWKSSTWRNFKDSLDAANSPILGNIPNVSPQRYKDFWK